MQLGAAQVINWVLASAMQGPGCLSRRNKQPPWDPSSCCYYHRAFPIFWLVEGEQQYSAFSRASATAWPCSPRVNEMQSPTSTAGFAPSWCIWYLFQRARIERKRTDAARIPQKEGKSGRATANFMNWQREALNFLLLPAKIFLVRKGISAVPVRY